MPDDARSCDRRQCHGVATSPVHPDPHRRAVCLLGAGLLGLGGAPHGAAQTLSKVWRLGYLDLGTRQSMVEAGRHTALLSGLRERGYVEGSNLLLESRFADGDASRLAALASELVALKPDLILSTGTPPSLALQRATSSIPIVITITADPVGDGFAANLARPGANITGLSTGVSDTVLKHLELLAEARPRLRRIAVLTNPTNATHPSLVASLQAAGGQSGIRLQLTEARTAPDIDRAFGAAVRARAEALIVLVDAFMTLQRFQIAALALRHQLPSIYPFAPFAQAGGLMSYGADTNDSFRRAAGLVDKILRGARPGELPFEQPTRYFLVINRKTAQALGLRLSNALLARADSVIE